jgi:RND superfamily putative drug exporter
METVTRWILRHRLIVAAFWLIVAVAGLSSAGSATNALSQQYSAPTGYEGVATNAAILRAYGTGGGASPLVPVITLPRGVTVATPGVRARLASAFAAVGAALPGARVVSYASTGDRAFVSADGRTTFALVYPFALPGAQAPPPVGTVERALAAHPIAGARVQVTGRDALATEASTAKSSGSSPGVLAETLITSLGALLILILVFGSFLAVVPLLVALVSIPTTFLLVWALTAVTSVNTIVEFLIALIGLGIAIDYSLLIVTRWREERARGHTNDEAVRRAMATAGRSVIFSGATVGISLLALVVLPLPFLRSVGYGGLLIPLVTVLVVCTLLPALLSAVGPRLDWPRHGHSERPSRVWAAWARGVVRRRWLAAGVATLILGALLFPLSGLMLGNPSVDALATTDSGPAYQGLRALETSGIGAGALDPIDVLSTPRDAAALVARFNRVDGVRGAVAPSTPTWQRAGTALIDVLPAADSTSASGRAALANIRQAAHDSLGQAPARVGGASAGDADFVAAIYGNFPLMIGLIALVTFVLLVRAFRSLLLPLKALLLNVVSVGAAWGAMTLVWQHGFGSKALWGIAATGSITAWIPLMIFAFLFGLSMDYEVFILSRMREEYDCTGSTSAAVVGGIGHTGRLVTSAALILMLTFVSLASSPGTDLKMLATGLAAGILLDATVVRMLLVPALVALLGRWNWWLPALPARLLRVQPSPAHTPLTSVEGARTASAAR